MFVFVAALRRWHSLNNESRCVFCNRVCIRGNMFPFSPQGRFWPGPVIVWGLITLKARLPGDISQRCLPVWKGLTCCLLKARVLQNLIRATSGKSYSLSSLPLFIKKNCWTKRSAQYEAYIWIQVRAPGRTGVQAHQLTLPGTYCQDVETFEIFKVSTCLPRREGTKFDALIIQ